MVKYCYVYYFQVIQIETRSLLPSDDLSASLRALNLDPKGGGGATLNTAPNATSTSGVVIEDVTDDVSEKTPLRKVTS